MENNEHNVALKAFLTQQDKRIKELEAQIRAMEEWKEKQPVWVMVNGKWEIVPDCFS
jgi:hypothetical protein